MKLKSCNFIDCNLEEADFTECNLAEANFDRAVLNRTVFFHTNLEQADFSTAIGYEIDPRHNSLRKARFSLAGVIGVGHHEKDMVEFVPVIVNASAPKLKVKAESMESRSVEKVELVADAATPMRHDLVEKSLFAQIQGNLARKDVEVFERNRLEMGPLHHADARNIARGSFVKADAIEVGMSCCWSNGSPRSLLTRY